MQRYLVGLAIVLVAVTLLSSGPPLPAKAQISPLSPLPVPGPTPTPRSTPPISYSPSTPEPEVEPDIVSETASDRPSNDWQVVLLPMSGGKSTKLCK